MLTLINLKIEKRAAAFLDGQIEVETYNNQSLHSTWYFKQATFQDYVTARQERRNIRQLVAHPLETTVKVERPFNTEQDFYTYLFKNGYSYGS